MSKYTIVIIKNTTSRTNERRASRTSVTNVTTPMTAQHTKTPAPRAVPTPTFGEPVANAAIEAITSHAAFPTARNVTPATFGDKFNASTARVKLAQKKSFVVVSTRCSKNAIHAINIINVNTCAAVFGAIQ
jgi:hypothetical protein